MPYKLIQNELGGRCIQIDNLNIPLDPNNRHYQECLDAIIKDGADAFDGDIPTDLQAAADAKKKEL